MGKFFWDVGVWSVDRERMETVSALVDTGASYSVFPEMLLESLGIWRLERVGFEQADGSIIGFDVGVAWMTINDRERTSSVAFGSNDSGALIGANALQEFLLLVNRLKNAWSLGGQDEARPQGVVVWESLLGPSASGVPTGKGWRRWMRW